MSPFRGHASSHAMSSSTATICEKNISFVVSAWSARKSISCSAGGNSPWSLSRCSARENQARLMLRLRLSSSCAKSWRTPPKRVASSARRWRERPVSSANLICSRAASNFNRSRSARPNLATSSSSRSTAFAAVSLCFRMVSATTGSLPSASARAASSLGLSPRSCMTPPPSSRSSTLAPAPMVLALWCCPGWIGELPRCCPCSLCFA